MDRAVQKKSHSFSVRIVNAHRYLRDKKREYIMSKQLLRSGTAIRALISEAEEAASKPDFINKMNIALKETNETKYWIKLLHETGYLSQPAFASLYKDNIEILKLLKSIINTAKRNLQAEKEAKKTK